ncbi:hypothetical protein [Foetidibacter luteolus]|uniref:hypothetical protein n=1 Tax=Foetidibacter luteolus TaxID=2608880 RepID=UPI00129BAB33|nr:hypothetical protein [Foetidibacter luteolus]
MNSWKKIFTIIPAIAPPKKLNRYEFQVYSQNGEDGIIHEIFKRIGVTNKFFIEFGVENGTECNTTSLLYNGWKGLWIGGEKKYVEKINKSCKNIIDQKKLTIINAFITAENIESLFLEANSPAEPDLLSIDIDRNNYYVWNAVKNYLPRVLIIEYNAIFRPGVRFCVPYEAAPSWDGTSSFGGSLNLYMN